MARPHRRSRGPLVAASMFAAFAIASPDDGSARLTRCLPDKSCNSSKTCCAFPHDALYRFELATKELSAEFYDRKRNREKAARMASGSSDPEAQALAMDQLYATWASTSAASQAIERIHRYVPTSEPLGSPTVDYLTDRGCEIRARPTGSDSPFPTPGGEAELLAMAESTSRDGEPSALDDLEKKDPSHPIFAQSTCMEFVAAAIEHERVHKAACGRRAKGLLGDRGTLDHHSNEERDAYADQAETLRMWRDQAKRSCKKALDQEALARAKGKVQEFNLASKGAR